MEQGEQIHSLSFLPKDALVINIKKDGTKNYFLVREIRPGQGGFTEIKLLEINIHLTNWKAILPTGCNAEGRFTSKDNSSHDFCFYEPKVKIKITDIYGALREAFNLKTS